MEKREGDDVSDGESECLGGDEGYFSLMGLIIW
jgi:hypothetical protein